MFLITDCGKFNEKKLMNMSPTCGKSGSVSFYKFTARNPSQSLFRYEVFPFFFVPEEIG